MPVLMRWPLRQERREPAPEASLPPEGAAGAQASPALLPACGNVRCQSGWMKLWRKRHIPLFEGKWACSPACMQEMVKSALQREMAARSETPSFHQHRVPLGLLLLSQGAITREQLKRALAAQRQSHSGRLGEWLVTHGAADEDRITRALGAQWNCPVLPAEQYDPSGMAAVLPRLLVDGCGALPFRLAGRSLLYVAFESKIDRCMMLAMEQMTGLKVEAGLLHGSAFRRLRQEALRAAFPKTRLLEAAHLRGLAVTMANMIEERKPVQARIVRVHDYFWLRLWHALPGTEGRKALPSLDEVEDMVCSLQAGGNG